MGYGQKRVRGKTYLAHRLVAAAKFGDITGKVVRHTCDNPKCVNPDHLELGSQRDNIHDMIRRGRQAKGNRLPQSKLSPEVVKAIRAEYIGKGGPTQAELAAKYGVAQSQISCVVHRRSWT